MTVGVVHHEKWKRVIIDDLNILDLILGVGVGSVLSLVLFKRKLWPITFGAGELKMC